ncbi:hypothetical protein BU17DRAFT_41529 [Hysterangium stoloniferum]|nr:hypothetical protein BU17DRAFT_41529 [Hysterangium stoloniferum]
MADVRALLKAKRTEQRISHPFAAYSQSGQLRCTICSTVVKHASAWNGHLGSKAHRLNAARAKEEEKKMDEEKRSGKRKASHEDEEIADAEDGAGPLKMQKTHDDTSNPNATGTGFPADFFSDPSRVIPSGDDSDDEAENPPSIPQPEPLAVLDLEWQKFQETVINAPTTTAMDDHEKFEAATIFAEPQLVDEVPQGFPSSVVSNVADNAVAEIEDSKDEVQERKRREEEDREIIMDRLLDEERAQEEADERVNILKARLDVIKQKRIAAKATKSKK